MAAYNRIIIYALLIAVGAVILLILFGQNGAWEELKDTVRGIPGLGISITTGSEAIQGDSTIPDDQRAAIQSMITQINRLSSTGGNECFAKVDVPFPLLEGSSIEMTYRNDKTYFEVKSGPGGDHTISDLTQTFDIRPCLVEGDEGQAGNFYNKFILKKEGDFDPTFADADILSISGRSSFFSSSNTLAVGSKSYTLPKELWLFKSQVTGNKPSICFLTEGKISNKLDGGIDVAKC